MTKAYKFDPHTHTAESSLCSAISAVELVEGYHAAGFGGIAITDHIHEYYLSGFNDWDSCIDYLLRGYKLAKARGDELGMDVILGVEIRFTTGGYSDYLLYGLDEDFLRKNPNMHRLSPQKFFKRHRDNLLIIQAHPFRGVGMPDISCVHGVEVYNGNPRHKNRNNKTRKLCDNHPKLYTISASDTHEFGDIGSGWMEFDRPVTDSYQFRKLVMGREYALS
ncbi:MAG: PHP domain-containing protein [Defluviitaleaceae bacterium]|nr:PHP domain-containing protein [Defluviitaleaceae bacterium]